jgi:hypothetical protein
MHHCCIGIVSRSHAAIGVVETGKVYRAEMSADFKPFRVHMRDQKSQEVPIRPLIEQLSSSKAKRTGARGISLRPDEGARGGFHADRSSDEGGRGAQSPVGAILKSRIALCASSVSASRDTALRSFVRITMPWRLMPPSPS